ncbi:RNase adapter RapZ [Rhodoluna sp. KAS3]|uniref:RNase adapter RapZ n=1 Tax=Rhodoluna sp. KAS3 TaxID=942880 RepID=UPI002230D2FF|nr:RNase adapter RapZ [Rhodoluna sp. KAS3]BDS49004.1 nucleotide-binding protein [Rhodoluna sp. KAS3]
MNSDKRRELLIVTGMSGAGRSTVGKALEDLGWYVVDNLPPQMLNPIADLFTLTKTPLPRLAVVIDVRGGEFFSELQTHLNSLRSRSLNLRVLFLEATDSALVKRFESVRRPHPLQGSGTILDGIAEERVRLLSLRESADVVIDTSDLNIHQLSNKIAEGFTLEQSSKLQINVMSFGFKYGLPSDADLVADARFLPNPFWQESLRPFTGEDTAVSDFVLSQSGAQEFVTNYVAALKPVLRGYLNENKRYATIAIGCTGGKHRSVAMSRAIADELNKIPDVSVTVKHRDLGKE